jgi:hypothetical protein
MDDAVIWDYIERNKDPLLGLKLFKKTSLDNLNGKYKDIIEGQLSILNEETKLFIVDEKMKYM